MQQTIAQWLKAPSPGMPSSRLRPLNKLIAQRGSSNLILSMLLMLQQGKVPMF